MAANLGLGHERAFNGRSSRGGIGSKHTQEFTPARTSRRFPVLVSEGPFDHEYVAAAEGSLEAAPQHS
jgi:hypothetical protein